MISFGLIVEEDGKDFATNGYQLLDGTGFYEDAVIRCARFKGNTRGVFNEKKGDGRLVRNGNRCGGSRFVVRQKV